MPNGSSHGWKKIETFEALASIRDQLGTPWIIGGDFNEPQAIVSGNRVISFVANKKHEVRGTWRGQPASRWQAGVERILASAMRTSAERWRTTCVATTRPNSSTAQPSARRIAGVGGGRRILSTLPSTTAVLEPAYQRWLLEHTGTGARRRFNYTRGDRRRGCLPVPHKEAVLHLDGSPHARLLWRCNAGGWRRRDGEDIEPSVHPP
jgi:hypothetical protein